MSLHSGQRGGHSSPFKRSSCLSKEKGPKALRKLVNRRKLVARKWVKVIQQDLVFRPLDATTVWFYKVFQARRRGFICTDNWVYENVVDTWEMRVVEATSSDIAAENLNQFRMFEMPAVKSTERACFTCCRMVFITTEITICQSFALVLHSLTLLVPDQPVSYPLLVDSKLEAYGLNTCEQLSLVTDRWAGVIDIERLIETYTTKEDGRILPGTEWVYHSAGNENENNDEEIQGAWYGIGKKRMSNDNKLLLITLQNLKATKCHQTVFISCKTSCVTIVA